MSSWSIWGHSGVLRVGLGALWGPFRGVWGHMGISDGIWGHFGVFLVGLGAFGVLSMGFEVTWDL